MLHLSASDIAVMAEQNDMFRQHCGPCLWQASLLAGSAHVTAGIAGLGRAMVEAIIRAVRTHTAFTEDTDPLHHHDFGRLEIADVNEPIYWKIDILDADGVYGSDHPTDPEKSQRILTIMLASEY